MKTYLASFLAVALASKASAILPLGNVLESTTDAVSDFLEEINNQCIVRLDDDLDENAVTGLVDSVLGLLADASIPYVYSGSINGFALSLPCTLAQTVLAGIGGVVDLVPDAKVSLERLLGPVSGTPKKNVARVGGARDGTGKTAWVLDTGILLNHPKLNVDASKGFTAFSKAGGSDATLNDTNGHGTHVAGTIGALPINGVVMGVAPGTKVVPVKVMKADGTGSLSAILAGIDHVAKNARPGDCVNMSLCAGGSKTLDDAVIRAAANSGAYWTIAAGNYNADARNFSPARATGKNVYTISAVDNKDRLASFSNFGSPVDFAAPGVNIESTWKDGKTSITSGTSMASPAACAVLMMTGGRPRTDGVAQDKDSIADKIIHF